MITITPLPHNNDERGFTAEYNHLRGGLQLMLYRKAGTVSGRHYHKGASATKNPEVLLVMHGQCTVNCKHIDDTEIQTTVVTGPTQLEIPPYIWHELIPVTDCVMSELNSIEEHKADTYYL